MTSRIVHISDVVDVLPAPASLSDSETIDIDLLITVFGYEERTIGVLRHLVERQARIAQVILLDYPPNRDGNSRYKEEAEDLLQKLGAQVYPQHGLSGLAEVIGGLADLDGSFPPVEIAVDISVMSGSLILNCLDWLGRLADKPAIAVSILYSEASQYMPTQENFQEAREEYLATHSLGLERDVLKVEAVGGLDGSSDPHLRDLVVTIPGFNRDRARAAISYVNPALLLSPEGNVIWWLSQPRRAEDHWRLEAMREILEINPTEITDTISTFDYKSVLAKLEGLYDAEWLRSNLTVAFHGSKLQAVAVGLFAIIRPSCRIIVSTPLEYNSRSYSKGVGDLWVIRIGDWEKALSTLKTVGTVRLYD